MLIAVDETKLNALTAAVDRLAEEVKALRLKETTQEVLTHNEAARYLKVAPRTLHEYKRREQIAFIQVGQKVLYTRRDLDTFLEEYRVPAR
ncbi:hypothetical protein GCM10027275_30790 [Rhabdobacter roseus]|uniref:Excisionase family DNA binding protein n=1 Tax=Rhabdobacter roseus TaxID=1655419 RepID=A0A840TXW5_9BACT|nr:helix-turn-helix domain-containing protein [Rhabdobacter roseus]MBB5285038.1 excisionase family DNA binding protein [Rhabdobacter roseus]